MRSNNINFDLTAVIFLISPKVALQIVDNSTFYSFQIFPIAMKAKHLTGNRSLFSYDLFIWCKFSARIDSILKF